MASELKKSLMNGMNEMTSKEADETIEEMKNQIFDGENPEDLLYDYGLEPDYIFDLI